MAESESSVFVCEGKKGGSLMSNGDGFFYRVKDKRSGKQWRLTCAIVKCGGKAVLINPGTEEKQIVKVSGHSCQPNYNFIQITQLRNKIMKRCAEENTKLSQIFLEETTKR
jgi:hypothetical protein